MNPSMVRASRVLVCASLLVAAAALSGCGISTLFAKQPAVVQAGEQLGISLATEAAVQANCPTSTYPTVAGCEAARVAKIAAVTTAINSVVTGNPAAVTVPALNAAVNAAIAKLSLSAEEQIAIKTFVSILNTYIAQKVSTVTGQLSSADVATLQTLVGWVTSATQLYSS